MKPKSLLAVVLTIVLAAACVSPGERAFRPDLFGVSALPTAATRTIVITSATERVHVSSGETVKFVVGDKTFAWNFTTPAIVYQFELNQVTPAGLLDHSVMAYIAPNPLHFGVGRAGYDAQRK